MFLICLDNVRVTGDVLVCLDNVRVAGDVSSIS